VNVIALMAAGPSFLTVATKGQKCVNLTGLSLTIPIDMEPMLATAMPELPEGDHWDYEPKWDGFRVIAHRVGAEITLISRGARPMTRYFPEIVAALGRLGEQSLVLDGEVIVIGPEGLDFDALLQRVHPADSRVLMLSHKTPAAYVAFDLLARGGRDLRGLPLRERRAELESALSGVSGGINLTPRTSDRAQAVRWFELFEGAGLDGVMAKNWEQPYIPGKRAWIKVKHERTADCVVIGFRWSTDGTALGSLLLGLYDDMGELHYVGHTSSFSAAEKRQLLDLLEPMRGDSGIAQGRAPGGLSRWSRGKDGKETNWESLRPELTCEVAYDKLQGGHRFRHATRFMRWRPDKPPAECKFDQIPTPSPHAVDAIFG
jgi:ATP-dependent DNA ligase